jgi:hypothetical protein
MNKNSFSHYSIMNAKFLGFIYAVAILFFCACNRPATGSAPAAEIWPALADPNADIFTPADLQNQRLRLKNFVFQIPAAPDGKRQRVKIKNLNINVGNTTTTTREKKSNNTTTAASTTTKRSNNTKTVEKNAPWYLWPILILCVIYVIRYFYKRHFE